MTAWPLVRLSELTTKVGSGATPRGGGESYKASGIPLIRSMNVHFDGVRDDGLAFLDDEQARALDGVTVRGGDVLLNITGASIGRVALAPARLDGARVNQHVCIIRTKETLDAQFLKLFLNAPEQQKFILDEESGATRQALTKDKILGFEVPLPPLNEQRRIVAKLESLQSRSRRAREALDAVAPLLEKLRQSILAAAFRGDLTKDWRAQNPNPEPAAALLARIRTERRQRWEAAELAKLKAKGKAPRSESWRAKYEEPEAVDATALPELPEGWCWAYLGEAFEVRVGATPSRSEPSYWDGDVPWVSSGEVAFCRIRATRESITAAGLANTSTRVHPKGTVLLGMIGEGKTRGQAAILEIEACNNQNSAAILVAATEVSPEYVYRYLEFEYERTRKVGSGNNQQALNKARVQAIPIALAPERERQEIERRVEKLLVGVDRLAAQVSEMGEREQSLARALLAKAFRGELIPQDPNDESADVLACSLGGVSPGSSERRSRQAKAAE